MSEEKAGKADLSALRIDRSKPARGPGRRRQWLHLFWLLVPVLLWFVYDYAIKEVTPATTVKLAEVHYLTGTDATAQLVATGYVVAQIKAAVSSKATGRLETMRVEEGDRVKAGEVIAELEKDDLLANLDLVKAQLKQFRADSTLAALNYARQQQLLNSGFAADEVVEQAAAKFHSAVANVEMGLAQVKEAEISLENSIIRAPFDGTVLTKDADVGEMVAPLAASATSRGAVVTIADMNSLEVEADVSESNIQKVIPNQPCLINLDAYPGVDFKGFVKKIVPTADRSRATVMVKIAFTNLDSRILPEMSARVNFMPVESDSSAAEQAPVLVVDNDALVMRAGERVVFLYEQGFARMVKVTLGRKLGPVTEIIAGLKAGDRAILTPPGGLADGDRIDTNQ